ncbi:pseudouridine synthase [Arenibaculum pallidiluteum]|uniref:pseudouridine synthase n=1 Tax=Arenibaculum pallidiluteum TaxID=2812559 RepID=UPI001A962EA7|nr:pseudouridine synthase [Arenibaculum pallidiluteum]
MAKNTKSEQDSPEDARPAPAGERIAKRLARAGVCSRRDAEVLVAEGRVAVNGAVLTTPATLVQAGDQVTVDGKPLPEPEATRLWRYHKPDGLVTSARDEKGRETVFDHLPPDMPRVVSVGRLDLTTEGLLLLTNDGELARHLELPATGWTRRYRVRVHGKVDPDALKRLSRGVRVGDVDYGPIEAELEREQGSNAWLVMSIKEGKNREVRRVLEHLGLQVTRLIRTAYGPFQLGKLERGEVEEVPRRVLRDQAAKFFSGREDVAQRRDAPAEARVVPRAVPGGRAPTLAEVKARNAAREAEARPGPRSPARIVADRRRGEDGPPEPGRGRRDGERPGREDAGFRSERPARDGRPRAEPAGHGPRESRYTADRTAPSGGAPARGRFGASKAETGSRQDRPERQDRAARVDPSGGKRGGQKGDQRGDRQPAGRPGRGEGPPSGGRPRGEGPGRGRPGGGRGADRRR